MQFAQSGSLIGGRILRCLRVSDTFHWPRMLTAMPTCPVCGFDNTYGALVCAQCYNLLTDVPVNSQESTLPGANSTPQTNVLSNHRHVDVSSLGADNVAMYFD